MFVISDLDGTLADVTHRRGLVSGRKRDWAAFFRACVDDPPIWPVINVVHALAVGGNDVEIWSGRSDVVRPETERWLANVGLGALPLRMRQQGDMTADDRLKERWLYSLLRLPDLVFDDRDKVVAMWRRRGVVCAQVAPGDF